MKTGLDPARPMGYRGETSRAGHAYLSLQVPCELVASEAPVLDYTEDRTIVFTGVFCLLSSSHIRITRKNILLQFVGKCATYVGGEKQLL